MANYRHLGGLPLRHFYNIDIEEENGSQVIYFNSEIHVEKRTRMPMSFSMEWAHHEILNDGQLLTQITERWGDTAAIR